MSKKIKFSEIDLDQAALDQAKDDLAAFVGKHRCIFKNSLEKYYTELTDAAERALARSERTLTVTQLLAGAHDACKDVRDAEARYDDAQEVADAVALKIARAIGVECKSVARDFYEGLNVDNPECAASIVRDYFDCLKSVRKNFIVPSADEVLEICRAFMNLNDDGVAFVLPAEACYDGERTEFKLDEDERKWFAIIDAADDLPDDAEIARNGIEADTKFKVREILKKNGVGNVDGGVEAVGDYLAMLKLELLTINSVVDPHLLVTMFYNETVRANATGSDYGIIEVTEEEHRLNRLETVRVFYDHFNPARDDDA